MMMRESVLHREDSHVKGLREKTESRSVESDSCNPMGYTVHGILQAGILEWVAVPFSRGSSQPRNGTRVSCIVGEFFTSWATREGKTHQILKYFSKNDSVWSAVKIEGEIKDIKWCYHLNLFSKLSPSLPLIDTSSIHLIKESTHNLTTIIT